MVDPRFEMGGGEGGTKCVCKRTKTSPQPGLGTLDITWNCDTIITISINKFNFEALCGHCF